jgi:hypothetical protein
VCVDGILERARKERAAAAARTAAATGATTSLAEAPDDDGVCPIHSAELWRYFNGVATPTKDFDDEAPEGAAFRAAMTRLPPATRAKLPQTAHLAYSADTKQVKEEHGVASASATQTTTTKAPVFRASTAPKAEQSKNSDSRRSDDRKKPPRKDKDRDKRRDDAPSPNPDPEGDPSDGGSLR